MKFLMCLTLILSLIWVEYFISIVYKRLIYVILFDPIIINEKMLNNFQNKKLTEKKNLLNKYKHDDKIKYDYRFC